MSIEIVIVTLLVLSLLIYVVVHMKTFFFRDSKVYDTLENYNYKYTKHKFHSSNDVELDATLIKTAKESKGYVFIANGMKQNMSFRFTQWLWIVDSGYDVFLFDYGGYGDSHIREIELEGFKDDVSAALVYAHSLDKDRQMIVIGQSMGGTFVINALKQCCECDYVFLVVIDATFKSFASVLSGLMMKGGLLHLSWLPYVIKPPSLNSIDHIEGLNYPILFVTGDRDFIVNCKDTRKIYEKSTAQKALWIAKKAGHVQSFNNSSVQKAFLELLEDRELFTLKGERSF